MDAEGGWRLGQRPQLDTLRAVAVLLVVAAHAEVLPGPAGTVGVTMFFTLSGFLITALLLEERTRHGRISLSRFYVRRARRLLPALALFVTCVGFVAMISERATQLTLRDFAGVLFYVGNFTTGMQGRDNSLLHLWSLSVEEQFYIIWPCILIVVLAVSRGRVAPLLAVAGLASMTAFGLRVWLWDDGAGALRVYFGTDTRMDSLLIGCMAAMWMHGRHAGRNRPLVAGALIVGAGMCSLADVETAVIALPAVVAALTALATLCLVQQPSTGLFVWRPLVLVGRRSYALYLWHLPLVGTAVSMPTASKWPALAIAALLTAAIVHLSWRCVEEPFLRRSDRDQHPRTPPLRAQGAPAPVARAHHRR